MYLKDLRPVIGEQTKTNVIVESGNNSAVSGELWLFSVDKSADDLKVKRIEPKNDVLELTLECDPSRLRDTNWDDTFNQKAIINVNVGPDDTITEIN